MLEAGSSIQRISQYLGHSNLSQTFKVYARYQPHYLREEANALDVTGLIANARNDSTPDVNDQENQCLEVDRE
jgi:hypothetical protein